MKTTLKKSASHTSNCTRLGLLLGLLAASLSGCASLGLDTPDQRAVSQRATARWQALVAADWATAYPYNTPGFNAVVDLASYKARFGTAVKWTGAEVLTVRCPEPDQCTARLRIDYRPLGVQANVGLSSTGIDEKWVRVDGAWFYFQPIKSI